jgi:hypothetical protein
MLHSSARLLDRACPVPREETLGGTHLQISNEMQAQVSHQRVMTPGRSLCSSLQQPHHFKLMHEAFDRYVYNPAEAHDGEPFGALPRFLIQGR